jgi:hypothetical protein
MRLDPPERPPCRLALPGLLVDVVVGRGDRIGVVELAVERHALQLHVATRRAADDVAQRGAEAVGRGNQPVRALVARDSHVRHQTTGRATRGA